MRNIFLISIYFAIMCIFFYLLHKQYHGILMITILCLTTIMYINHILTERKKTLNSKKKSIQFLINKVYDK